MIMTRIENGLAARPTPLQLTPKELEVLKLITEGLSNKQIAAELCTTEGTVKSYANSIFIKLGVHNRTQAATTALKRRLFKPY